MHGTEIARDRDAQHAQVVTLRAELDNKNRECETLKQSIIDEKQNLEHRLDEERRAKERARQQLDTRVDALQKRKSKFACL